MSLRYQVELARSETWFLGGGLQEIIGGKHKLKIVWDLQNGSRRFGEIRKRLSLGAPNAKEVAPRVLSRELKALTALGLIHRKAYNLIPPRVEYRLTSLGQSLLPVIASILEWGKRHPVASPPARESLIWVESSSGSVPSGPLRSSPAYPESKRESAVKYPWQRTVMEAFRSPRDTLSLKIGVAERAIVRRLRDSPRPDTSELLALKEDLRALDSLLSEMRPKATPRAERERREIA